MRQLIWGLGKGEISLTFGFCTNNLVRTLCPKLRQQSCKPMRGHVCGEAVEHHKHIRKRILCAYFHVIEDTFFDFLIFGLPCRGFPFSASLLCILLNALLKESDHFSVAKLLIQSKSLFKTCLNRKSILISHSINPFWRRSPPLITYLLYHKFGTLSRLFFQLFRGIFQDTHFES